MIASARPVLTIFGDTAARKVVTDHLAASRKYRLASATTLHGATESLNAACFDALFLDVQLPDGDGVEFCSTLRSLGHKIPIILVGDGSGDADVVRGLDAGANDYITDITRLEELSARLRAQLRVFDNSRDATLTIGSFSFRPPEKLLLSPQTNRRIRLTNREADLLTYFHRLDGAFITRQRLLSEVWGYKIGAISNTVDTHIYSLRKKMAIDDRCGTVITMPGGYRLETPVVSHDRRAIPF
jgi:DNA-binding response OmpR family regulator